MPRVDLLPGKYLVRAHALDPEGVRLFDCVERSFVVTGTTREMGFVRLPHRWGSVDSARPRWGLTLDFSGACQPKRGSPSAYIL